MEKYFKLFRISDWIKNIFIFVPLIFSKNLFVESALLNTIYVFFLFSITASAIYIFNDIMDAEMDKLHPTKKNRPIASGSISKKNAWVIFVSLVLMISFVLNFFYYKVIYLLLVYFFINILYSIILKKIVLVDIFIIAAGFMLRMLIGGYVIQVYISSWLILTTLFVSLFLAILKRKSELENVNPDNPSRKVLKDYSKELIDHITTVSAAGIIICYALYSVSQNTINYFNSDKVVYTTIFVVFGIFRYIYLVIKDKKGENIINLFLKDFPILLNCILYFALVIYLIYL